MAYALAIESDSAFVLVLAFEPEQQTAEGRAGQGTGDGDGHGRNAVEGGPSGAEGTKEDQNGVAGARNEDGPLLRRTLRYGRFARIGQRVVIECTGDGLADISTRISQ